jgi:hypothetical protein
MPDYRLIINTSKLSKIINDISRKVNAGIGAGANKLKEHVNHYTPVDTSALEGSTEVRSKADGLGVVYYIGQGWKDFAVADYLAVSSLNPSRNKDRIDFPPFEYVAYLYTTWAPKGIEKEIAGIKETLARGFEPKASNPNARFQWFDVALDLHWKEIGELIVQVATNNTASGEPLQHYSYGSDLGDTSRFGTDLD